MLSKLFVSTKMILLSSCIIFSSLSASMNYTQCDNWGWQIPEEAISTNLGGIQLFHDDNNFTWTVVDEQGCAIAVDINDVAPVIRYVTNLRLSAFLGENVYYGIIHNRNRNAVIPVRNVHLNVTLRVTKDSEGYYHIREQVRGDGGGPFCGLFATIVVRVAGACTYNSNRQDGDERIRKRDVLYSCLCNAVTTAVTCGISAYLESAKFAKDYDGFAKLFKDTDKAEKAMKKAAEGVDTAMKAAEKAAKNGFNNVKYITRVDKAKEAYEASKKTYDSCFQLVQKETVNILKEVNELDDEIKTAKGFYDAAQVPGPLGQLPTTGFKPTQINFNLAAKDTLDTTVTTVSGIAPVTDAQVAAFVDAMRTQRNAMAKQNAETIIDMTATVAGLIFGGPWCP